MSNKTASPSSLSENAGLRWAVFVSGYGSNLQAIIDADPKINIQLVVSNSIDAYGVERAKKHGIETLITPFVNIMNDNSKISNSSKKIDWDKLHQLLLNHKIDRIFLAGFMKIIPLNFIQPWKGRMLNLHPSLLPEFPGLNAIEKSYQAGGAMGATVHYVTAELDGGPILIQRVAISKDDRATLTLEEAKERIHNVEHQISVEAIRRLTAGEPSDVAKGIA